MNKQQKELQQVFLDNEKEVLKKLKENYQDALAEINSKIELLMARQDADMQHVIYQVEYQKMLKTQIQSILEQLQTNEFETVSEYLSKCYEDGFIGAMYDMQNQGVPLVMPIDQEQVVAAIQHETKLSEDLYTALGKDVKVLQKKISGEISRGIASGQMYSEIARNISSYAGISQNNAIRIARTEGHRIQCKATADAQWKAKSKGADVVKQWDSALDSKTRKSHRELDGQIRELEEEFEVNGHKAMHPSGFNIAKEDINCRCALLQRARWALEEEHPATKWAEDAPVLIDDDGTTQFVDISDAKNYKQFKERYQQQVTQGTQKMKANAEDAKDEWKESFIDGGSVKDTHIKGAHGIMGDFVPYDENATFAIDIPYYSNELNDSLSKAARKVAEHGSKHKYEYSAIIDVSTGEEVDFGTSEEYGCVSNYYKFLREHLDGKFIMIHNHNAKTPLSLPDMQELVMWENLDGVISASNDGYICCAVSNGNRTNKYLFSKYKEGDYGLDTSQSEIEQEMAMVNLAAEEFTKGGILTYGE